MARKPKFDYTFAYCVPFYQAVGFFSICMGWYTVAISLMGASIISSWWVWD